MNSSVRSAPSSLRVSPLRLDAAAAFVCVLAVAALYLGAVAAIRGEHLDTPVMLADE